jgi:hypothetical protein
MATWMGPEPVRQGTLLLGLRPAGRRHPLAGPDMPVGMSSPLAVLAPTRLALLP